MIQSPPVTTMRRRIFTSTETLYGAAGNEKLTAPPTALHELTSKLNAPENKTSDRTEAAKATHNL